MCGLFFLLLYQYNGKMYFDLENYINFKKNLFQDIKAFSPPSLWFSIIEVQLPL